MSATTKIKTPATTLPRFAQEASEIAMLLSQCSVEELGQLLHVNPKIALENYLRYQLFHAEETPRLPALLAYTGIVFKRLSPQDFTADDFNYAQSHLRLTSFCYGLLRPFDVIAPYRLEGDVRLPELSDGTLFTYWQSRLTDTLIADVKEAGGTLCNLASEEMKNLFDWKRVEREVNLITPEFHVWKNGKRATVVVYTKMARGEMTRFLLKNRITHPDEIKRFDREGFTFDPAHSTDTVWEFVQDS